MKHFILIFVGFAVFNFQNVHGQVNESDSLAMLEFYETLNGDNWTNNTNWLSSTSMTQWYGLQFEDERLYAIDMKDNNCSGMIAESLGNCTELEELFLLENDINEIADLDSLHLMRRINLASNSLRKFPDFISKCKNLERLNLYDNDMEGGVPVELDGLKKMNELSISKNQLSGEMPSLQNLDQLTVIDFSLNGELEGNLQDILYDSLLLNNLNISNSNISGELLPSYFDKELSLRLFADSSKIDGIDQLQDFNISKIWVRHTDLGFVQLMNFLDQNSINQYYYSPQNDIQGPEEMGVSLGMDVTLTCLIDGADDYQWYKDGQFIQGEKSIELVLQEVSTDDEGAYHCIATQSSLPLLTMKQTPTELKIQTTGVSDRDKDFIAIFPNPAENYIQFREANFDTSSYSIFNTSGVLIDKGIINNSMINVADYKSGLYTLLIISGDYKANFQYQFIKL